VLSRKLKTPLLLVNHAVLFTFELLACDRVRQKRCLEVVSADEGRYDDEVESQIRTKCRESDRGCEESQNVWMTEFKGLGSWGASSLFLGVSAQKYAVQLTSVNFSEQANPPSKNETKIPRTRYLFDVAIPICRPQVKYIF
jgi:hypothetical protein